MGKIKIDVDVVAGMSPTIDMAEQKALNVENVIRSVRYSADLKVLTRNNLQGRFISLENRMAQLRVNIAKIEQAVESGASQYKITEDRIVLMGKGRQVVTANSVNLSAFLDEVGSFDSTNNNDLAEDKHVYTEAEISLINKAVEEDDAKTVLSFLGVEGTNEFTEDDYLRIFGSANVATYLMKIKNGNGSEILLGNTNLEAETGLKTELESKKISDAIEDGLKDKGVAEDVVDETDYFKDGKTIDAKDAPTFYDKEQTLAEIDASTKVSVDLLNVSSEGGYGKVSAKVGEAEAHAGIAAGLYVLGADNEKILSPGVNAEVGTSVTVLEAEWEKQLLGNEMIGLNADATVTAGKAEAGAEAVAQFMGEDGKIDVQLGVSAEAEAIAGEVEGSIGLNVLGGEVGLGGSLNFGAGAHADIGFKEGVIKCDVGVALGVGASVNVEIDVGGMVNTVVDGATSAWNGFTDVVGDVGDVLGDFFGF